MLFRNLPKITKIAKIHKFRNFCEIRSFRQDLVRSYMKTVNFRKITNFTKISRFREVPNQSARSVYLIK